MRNLLGRLHARSAEDLARIAAFWRVPLGSGGHHAQVGPLYRVLTDPRAVRGAWDRLGPDDRALVRHLAIAEAEEATPTLAELAARLGVSEGEARETAVRLYRVGILAREGDDEPLPVGAAPRLFLPRELGQLFRRVQDEIEAGDLSGTPLRALLALLDDGEIEEAAAIWGVRVVPGLRRREDLTRQLLRQLGDPARVAKVVAERRRDAARLWRRVRDEPNGAPVALDAATHDAGLAGDEPRAAQRFRAALAELESALLLWHTYRRDGSRWLFVPTEIRAPGPLLDAELPALAPVAATNVAAPPWLHPHALAWDLLTVLRELADGEALPWPAVGEPPRARLRRLNQWLWRRGEETPPIGYVEFLVALGLAEGLVQADEGNAAALTPASGVRHWRDRTFAAQTERLAWWWRASPEWIEGRRLGEVEVWGADWRGARRKLLDRLADPAIGLVPGEWYALDSVAARFAAHDPDLLGSTVTVATARPAARSNGAAGDESARVAAVAEVARVELASAFAWFGLVEVGDVPGRTRVVRVGATLTPQPAAQRAPRPSAVEGEPSAPVEVSAEGEIVLREPTPLRVWSLSAFAEPDHLGPVSRYRLTVESMRRALAAGFDLAQVTAFLTKQSSRPLPPALADQLAGWARSYRRVRIRRALLLTPDDPAALPELRRVAEDAGFAVRAIDDHTLSLEGAADGEGEPEALIGALLRAHGYAPRVEAGPIAPTPVGPGRRGSA